MDYAALIDGVDANIWEGDATSLDRTFVSRHAVEMLGYPRDDWYKPSFWIERLHPDDRASVVNETRLRVKRYPSYAIEYRFVRADGAVVWVHDAVRVTGNVLRGVMTDITELRSAFDALRRSEERFRAIFENARDYAIFTMDLEGRITAWNPGAEIMMGFTEQEMVGKSGAVIFTPEDQEHGDPEAELGRALRAGRSINERWHMHKSGRRFWASGLMMPMKDQTGRVMGFLKILRETTEQMRLHEQMRLLNQELELRVAERTAQLEASNRELESFSYSVSHDLHSPLRKIDGYSLILLQDHAAQLDAKGREHLGRIRAASQHMARLIDDMLNLARVVRGPMKVEEVDVTAMSEAFAAELKRGAPSRDTEIVVMPGLRAKADPQLLGIALFNLLDNAWKFTSKTARGVVEVGRLQGRETAYFVRDNGAGFDPAFASKLFREFSRLHGRDEFPGTGIGLATVRRIVERHGGRIWAEGRPGEGATFFFTLNE